MNNTTYTTLKIEEKFTGHWESIRFESRQTTVTKSTYLPGRPGVFSPNPTLSPPSDLHPGDPNTFGEPLDVGVGSEEARVRIKGSRRYGFTVFDPPNLVVPR